MTDPGEGHETVPLRYPGTSVYRNLLDIRDRDALDRAEALHSTVRTAELADHPIDGLFDLDHLQRIHRHILGDVYAWAGEIRTVQTYIGDPELGLRHDRPDELAEHAATVFAELHSVDNFRGLDRTEYADALAGWWTEMTAVHPFIDGNSRTQRVFVDQLTREAGWEIDWRTASSPAIQAGRNVGYILGDPGPLRDVLAPLIVEPGTVSVQAVAQPGSNHTRTYGQHFTAMLHHIETADGTRYTWSTQQGVIWG